MTLIWERESFFNKWHIILSNVYSQLLIKWYHQPNTEYCPSWAPPPPGIYRFGLRGLSHRLWWGGRWPDPEPYSYTVSKCVYYMCAKRGSDNQIEKGFEFTFWTHTSLRQATHEENKTNGWTFDNKENRIPIPIVLCQKHTYTYPCKHTTHRVGNVRLRSNRYEENGLCEFEHEWEFA